MTHNENTRRLQWLGANIKARRWGKSTWFLIDGNHSYTVAQSVEAIVREFEAHGITPSVSMHEFGAAVRVRD